MCFEQVHSTPGKMVSQSTSRRDSPMDPCEGSSHASEDTDGFPSILDTDHPSCQLDVRLTRHKASWINQVCVQEELPQDLCLQGATVQNSRKLLVVDTPSPSDLSLLCHGDSLALTPMSENTADAICCSSAHGSEGRNDDFSMATDKQEVHPQQESLLRNPKTVATSPFPKEDRARFESLRLTASADDGNSIWGLPLFFSTHVFVWAGLKLCLVSLP